MTVPTQAPTPAPLEQGVGSSQHAVDDVEIAALETIHHLCQQVWPLLGEVFPPNDTDGITQLPRKENHQGEQHTALVPRAANPPENLGYSCPSQKSLG